MPAPPPAFVVVSTPAFSSLVAEYEKEGHGQARTDLAWLAEKLGLAPRTMGERVPQLQKLALPIYKTRCKDTCHKLGQSSGWRIYYALNEEARTVFLLFLHHKKEYENPSVQFLIQKLEKAFSEGLKGPGGK